VWQPDILTNAISAEMIKSMQSFASELCILLIISDDFPCVTISGCHTFLAFFPGSCQIAVRGSTSRYCCYVPLVRSVSTGNADAGSNNKIGISAQRNITRASRRNLLISFRSSPTNHHHRTTNELFVVRR
jgi:hypothetical protein